MRRFPSHHLLSLSLSLDSLIHTHALCKSAVKQAQHARAHFLYFLNIIILSLDSVDLLFFFFCVSLSHFLCGFSCSFERAYT